MSTSLDRKQNAFAHLKIEYYCLCKRGNIFRRFNEDEFNKMLQRKSN